MKIVSHHLFSFALHSLMITYLFFSSSLPPPRKKTTASLLIQLSKPSPVPEKKNIAATKCELHPHKEDSTPTKKVPQLRQKKNPTPSPQPPPLVKREEEPLQLSHILSQLQKIGQQKEQLEKSQEGEMIAAIIGQALALPYEGTVELKVSFDEEKRASITILFCEPTENLHLLHQQLKLISLDGLSTKKTFHLQLTLTG